jgi:two-component system, sensor histidine kinase RegB
MYLTVCSAEDNSLSVIRVLINYLPRAYPNILISIKSLAMQNATLHNFDVNRKNLLQLIVLRLIAIMGQVLTILFVQHWLHISLPASEMFLVVAALIAVNFISFYRYKFQKNISDKSLFLELLFDVAALAAQIYFSGGVSNPFISLFLLQVIIAAILLRAFYAWMLAAATTSCYIFLSFYYRELHAFHHHGEGDFLNMHLHGMLISYVIAAILLLVFVTKIRRNLKEGDEKINVLQRQALEKERIVRMGLLATGAAHELGTPLSTILVVLNDWQKMKLEKSMAEDVTLIESQIIRCQKIISEILTSSGKERLENAKLVKVKKAFDDLLNEWKNSRKPQNLIYNFAGESESLIMFDSSLSQAFFNIFDNALEASENFVLVNISSLKKNLIIEIEDRGSGFDSEILKELGSPNLSKKNSSGLGLFLAINVLNRLNGRLEIKNLELGSRVIITIPN